MRVRPGAPPPCRHPPQVRDLLPYLNKIAHGSIPADTVEASVLSMVPEENGSVAPETRVDVWVLVVSMRSPGPCERRASRAVGCPGTRSGSPTPLPEELAAAISEKAAPVRAQAILVLARPERLFLLGNMLNGTLS